MKGLTSIKVTFCHSFNQIFITNHDGDLVMSKSERILVSQDPCSLLGETDEKDENI